MSTVLEKPTVSFASDLPKRWTTAEFDRLLDLGLLVEGSNTYLWEGQIVDPMPESQPHYLALANLSDLLRERFPSALWSVFPDAPLELEDGTKPQPDLIALRGPRPEFRVHTPRAESVALLVEVCHSTYPRDSGERLRKYASMAVPFYWIVNIPARRVEVYELPDDPDVGPAYYEKRTDYGLDMMVPLDVAYGAIRVNAAVAAIDILRDSIEQTKGEGQG